MAISHREGDTVILDAVRETKAPFNPEAVVDEYVTLLKTYRISRECGDRYAGEWPREQFRKRGANYEPSEKTRSELYLDIMPPLNAGAVHFLPHDRLLPPLV